MTPEALLGAFALFDRWALTVRSLTGEAMPVPHAQPGRVHRWPPDREPEDDAARLDAEMRAAAVWRSLAADSEGGDHD